MLSIWTSRQIHLDPSWSQPTCPSASQFFVCLVFWIWQVYFYHVQICYTVWTNIGICSPSWDTVPWFCHNCWTCHHWAPSEYSLVMDGTKSPRDGWSTLWLPFSLEHLQFLTFVWGVSLCRSISISNIANFLL